MWGALLIPVVVSWTAYHYFHKEITRWELLLPMGISVITIFCSYLLIKTVSMRDVEYNGDLVVAAKYYEPWETYVSKTCVRTYKCGKSTCTQVYDCSYCDEHAARYEAILKDGSTSSISAGKYESLIKKWNAKPTFIELNRHIDRSFTCGKDGDAYVIKWDNKIESSEAHVRTVSFSNPVKVSHSAFRFPDMSAEQADSLGLYHYPELYSGYRQRAVLSHDFRFKEILHTKFEFLNGVLGPEKKVKVFTLLFKNQPIQKSLEQEQYWEGGNQNEVVVCIGVDDKLNVQWVRPFTWCDNKRVAIDLREDVAALKVFDPDAVLAVYYRVLRDGFKYKSFKDFNYLSFDPTTKQLVLVYLVTLIASVLATVYIVKNDYQPVNEKV